MAEGGFSQDQFSCPVCLDLLKDPVTIPCGHSYCMGCITEFWNREDQTRVYSCPQCRQTFTTRPALYKNVMFAEVIEKLKKTNLQGTGLARCYTGIEHVECDICTGRKYRAVKSCLACLRSYCGTHLEQHDIFFQFNNHNLMNPTRGLNEMICSKHKQQLEIYCRTDQQCICYPCIMDKHKNHETVPAATERNDKQIRLGEMQRKCQQRIQEKENELHELKKAVESHKRSAHEAVKDSERIFTELIRFIERRRSEVTQLIRDQEKTAVSQAEGFLKTLQQEIVDLKKRKAELEQLSHIENHIHFLKGFQSLSPSPESPVSHNLTVSPLLSYDDVKKSVSQLKEKLEDFCNEETEKISGRVTYITIIPTNNPRTREEFLQYSNQFTLDSSTVNKHLLLFDGNRMATNTYKLQLYPDHPERFDHWFQVLCKESVSGRSYWEVEWSGNDFVYISVSYKSIGRKGESVECIFGRNNQSWSLYCCHSKYSFGHNNYWSDLPVSSSCSRIGVYVDHSAGTLSFYSVSDTMTLIHRVQTTFTQPLYPGFYINKGSTVKMCEREYVRE